MSTQGAILMIYLIKATRQPTLVDSSDDIDMLNAMYSVLKHTMQVTGASGLALVMTNQPIVNNMDLANVDHIQYGSW